ncbi:SMP-30/gluconolactonase/LRE family protein [Gemmata sp. JC717]|uniref:SMP-30/gluconolactonase/LRE family protein n=1 Tax=Gemmata algarum TaxID=2975278 RepID=UPI0021BAE3AD|nr:SMP-30/gluconolactonase/LRE family protein [Gemmata algarum]MDY3552648.1 SMP-30/gluconolactonase/LRE family protein [Gemmata algarum]
MSRPALALLALLGAPLAVLAADTVPANKQYQAFVLKQAAELRKGDKPPATLAEWEKVETELRKNLFDAWGGAVCFLPKPCDLDPKRHGEPLTRDGYTVEKLTIQTRPGVRMTCNLYVPDSAKTKPAPAILQVHGHWKGAKQDPVVQSRCIGAAKLGFVVLCVDAFGAGERGVGTALGEYHGDMTAATLLPIGLPLSGLQVYENMRAVDYLETRPEVDKTRIGITGASGGGNQTMYAGAWDKRFKAVMPVCSVGSYQAYLQTACCMCEVVPGALKFTEEWAVLALTAPRALCVANATKDGIQFSVSEAKKSLAFTAPVFKLLGKPDNLQHAVFEGPHDYSKSMRETMYGFMTLHLKGEGNGEPIPEPKFATESPEDLRCYPGGTRPKDFVTIPKFAAQEARKLLEAKLAPSADGWRQEVARVRTVLIEKSLGGFPAAKAERTPFEGDQRGMVCSIRPEPGLEMCLTNRYDWQAPPLKKSTLTIVLSLDGNESETCQNLEEKARSLGSSTLTLDLRAVGSRAFPTDRVGRAPDHNSAEWGLWLGRPLLGQWVFDVHQVLSSFPEATDARGRPVDQEIVLIGNGPAGVVALCAAAVEKRITKVVAINTLTSFVTDEPYTNQRLGVMAPGLLRDIGDVAHLAALCTPKRVIIAGGVSGGGAARTVDQLTTAYAPASAAFELIGRKNDFVITTPDRVLKELDLLANADKDEPIFEPGAKLITLAGKGAAGEGPAWDADLGVLTSGEKGIHVFTPKSESKVWLEKAGTNGLLFDRNGSLVCCEPVSRAVSRVTRDGKRTVLTDSFGGKKYNQPNDLTIDSKNRIYFSDPRYGPRNDMQQFDENGKTIEGVYRIDTDGKVSRVIGREIERANGVLISADDKYLFVADNNNDKGGARKLWRFNLKANGTVDLKSQKMLYDWKTGRGPDGIKQDAKGRLYVAGGLNKPTAAEPAEDVKGGIYVIDPESGKLIAFLAVPTDEVTNCAFGGPDLKTLYITGGGTLYSVRTTTPGRVIWPNK